MWQLLPLMAVGAEPVTKPVLGLNSTLCGSCLRLRLDTYKTGTQKRAAARNGEHAFRRTQSALLAVSPLWGGFKMKSQRLGMVQVYSEQVSC